MDMPEEPQDIDDPVPGSTGALNLKEVALLLDVHYMTVYRYVRHGRLPAHRHRSMWFVERADAEAFQQGSTPSHPSDAVDWCDRLITPLTAGDEVACWTVVRDALGSGRDFAGIHLEVIVGALARIGQAVADQERSPVEERIAVATASRLVARLGGQFPRRGRKKGAIVLAAPVGEYHGFPLTVVANLIRHAGFEVVELGTDTSADHLLDAIRLSDDLVAVGIGVTTVARLDAAIPMIAAVRAVHPSLPVLLGGQAVRNPEIAELAGACSWSMGPDLVEILDALAESRQRRRAAEARKG